MGSEYNFDDDDDLKSWDDGSSSDAEQQALLGQVIERRSNRAKKGADNLSLTDVHETLGQGMGWARGKLSGLLGTAKSEWDRPASRDYAGDIAQTTSKYVEPVAGLAGHTVGVAAAGVASFGAAAGKTLFAQRRGESIKDWAKRAGRNLVVSVGGAWLSFTAFVNGCLPGRDKPTPKAEQPRETVAAPANPASSSDSYTINIPKLWK